VPPAKAGGTSIWPESRWKEEIGESISQVKKCAADGIKELAKPSAGLKNVRLMETSIPQIHLPTGSEM